MIFDVKDIDVNYDFRVNGCSFIGQPMDNTVMFLTSKIEKCLDNMKNHKECLVFIDKDISINDEYKKNNCFIACEDPEVEYGRFLVKISKKESEKNNSRKYTITEDGYTIGENVFIGDNCLIEAGCFIDHDVVIGNNAIIKRGTTIRNAIIGDNFYSGEGTIVGAEPYFYAGEGKDKFRIPAFGKVIILKNVEVGPHVCIEKGFNSNTIIRDNVKIDSLVSIGHDDIIGKNVSITSGAVLAGLVEVSEDAFIGLNATIKQRVKIGTNSMVGMGSVVINNVKDGVTVFGNPARKLGC